jgi:hypothetical protein
MTEHIAEVHNAEDNMTAVVFKSNHKAGGYGVALRDDDSGLFVGLSFHGFKTVDAAMVKASEVA